MIKRTLLLSMAAYGSASTSTSSLRGPEGVEEVSEGLEHFPPAHYGVGFDRRLLKEQQQFEDEDDEAEWVVTSEIFYDNDEEGNAIVEEEDWEKAWVIAQEEDGEEEDTDFGAALEEKAYSRKPQNAVLVGTDLLGEAVDQYDRREAASCGENKSEFRILLRTDNYGYETKWSLHNIGLNSKLGSGPPQGKNYARKGTYAGRWCLPPGRYNFKIKDTGNDGICQANYGCGYLKLFLNGQSAGRLVGDSSNWGEKNFAFTVAPGSSRIDGTNGNNNGNWCAKVRNKISPDEGKCNGGNGYRVKVTIRTDKFGEETKFDIKQNGQTKMQLGPVIPGDSARTVEKCLPAGSYVFRIEDFDGICCKHGEGGYSVRVNGEELLTGGSFFGSESHSFQLGYDWLNTMTERDCEWWWAHDYRREDWHTRCYNGQYCNKKYRHLKWSPSLKAHASTYARKLLNTCDSSTIEHDDTDQGENLAKNKGRFGWGEQYEADLVTKRFVDNEEFWGWNGNAHLTQAMWYATRYMGCAESVKDMDGNGKMCRFQVCRFAKAGNCMMDAHNAKVGNNWMKAMMQDDSPCGPMCPPGEGCYN